MVEQGSDVVMHLPLRRRISEHRFSERELLVLDVVVVIAVFVFVATFGPHKTPRVTGSAWRTARYAGDLVAGVAVLWRRRIPWVALGVVAVITLVDLGLREGGPSMLYLVLAVYSVVVVTSRTTGRGVAAVVVVAAVLGVMVGGGSLEGSSVTGVAATIVVGWLAGESARTNRLYARHQSQLVAERAAEAAARQADEIQRAIAGERVKIARELHDVVAHAMSVIAVRAGAGRMVIDAQPEQAREALSIIETTTRRTLHEMRLLVGMLRDGDDHGPEFQPAPGVDDVARLVEEIGLAGVDVDVQLWGTPRALPPAVDLSAYRIIQEALTNVVRHAGPTRAHVKITYRSAVIEIAVTDDGVAPGAPPGQRAVRRGAGHGILGMRERTALFGGTLSVEPHDRGYRVSASLRTDG